MSDRSRLVQGIAAGVGVFLVCVWPVVLIWRAGASGSLGDLSELRFLGLGLLYSAVLALVAGRLVHRSLAEASRSGSLGRLDPWGAYALAVGVFTVVVTALPALLLLLLVHDEHDSLQSREWMIAGLWVAGHLAAAVLGVAAGRALLRPPRSPRRS